MTIFKKIILITFISLAILSCGTVKKAFDPDKNTGDEFLVEKKSPLSMPPDYDSLPIPKSDKKNISNLNQDTNLDKLITGATNTNNDQNTNSGECSQNFEKCILDKIKEN